MICATPAEKTDDHEPAARTQLRGHTLVITINRPHARNAVNAAVSIAVGDALARANRDPQVRAIVLTGAGDASFCAGADLKAIARGEDLYHPDHPEWGFAGYARHFVDKPTIAAVNGTALGGGTELVLASDLAVSDRSATFGLPEVKRGLMAAAGGLFRIVEQLPRKRALQLIFTGASIPADEAAAAGLINYAVPDGTAVEAALQLAEQITVNAPLSVQASKRVALGADNGVLSAEQPGWARTSDENVRLKRSSDAQEGPRAFLEKRPPVWTAT
jgi:crotonobetainyl-CoA hydratase